MIICFKKTVKQ